MPNIELDDDLVNQAESYASANGRTVAGQIEHWVCIARLMEKTQASFNQLTVQQLLKAGIV